MRDVIFLVGLAMVVAAIWMTYGPARALGIGGGTLMVLMILSAMSEDK